MSALYSVDAASNIAVNFDAEVSIVGLLVDMTIEAVGRRRTAMVGLNIATVGEYRLTAGFE